ncbi:MAG: terpene synthase [Streptomycetaceae bacterium]|nr:terpene synthase [Streptomycetaceae bacterium]
MAKFHAVLFSLDDSQCDEVAATPGDLARTTSSLLRALEGGDDSDDDTPHAAAMRKLRAEIKEHASPNQLRRWAEAMRTYAYGLVWEAEYRQASSLPSLNDYIAMWMRAIGMAPSTALIDVTAGYEVPDRDLERPAVRALTEMTWTLVSWDNDFYSRNKEISRAGDNLNLIDVLARERGCDPAEALAEAVAMRDRVMVHFLRLRHRVAVQGARSELHCYLNGLGNFIRGHLDWASRCARYSAPSVAPVAAPMSPADWWKEFPADDSQEPLPIPAIAWWWGPLDA